MIVFTICSNNYLPFASVLRESLKKFHPDWPFFIGLVDILHEKIDYEKFQFDEIIQVEKIGIPDFALMCETYNLVELNTAVKPYFFSYIFENFVSVSEVIYLDPDIQITSNLDLLQGYFTQSSILLTPHFSTPHIGQAGIITTEQRILQRGMYNLGFIGIKNDDNGKEMLDWWQRNLKKNCVNQPEKGLFVDQKWIDLVPLYFKQVAILKKLGLDIAYWNLYENQLHKIDNIIFVGEQPLRFYHFSAYQKDDPKYLSRLLAPFNSEMTDIMTDLYLSYHQKLIACGLKDFQKIPCHYQKKSNWFSIKKSQLKKIAAILRK